MNNIHGFERKVRDAICAARELCYSQDTITRIENAKSEAEIERILIDARRKELNGNWYRRTRNCSTV